MAPDSPEELFAALRSADGARPVITFYDDATGERAELSASSLGNWIAKTHFLLIDELGLGPGDRAYVHLPMHWLDPAVRLGVWSAGLEIVAEPAGAAVAFVDASAVPAARVAGDVYALALAPWGRRFTGGAPAGSLDFVDAVRPQPDAWAGVRFPGGPSDPAAAGRTRRQLVDVASARAAELGWPARARVLFTDAVGTDAMATDTTGTDTTGRPGVDMELVLAAWSVGGSVVLVRHAAPDAAERLRAQEHLTHVAPPG